MGASWYAASKLTTACQLRGLPTTAVLGGQTHAQEPRRSGALEQLSFERLVPAGEIARVAVAVGVRR